MCVYCFVETDFINRSENAIEVQVSVSVPVSKNVLTLPSPTFYSKGHLNRLPRPPGFCPVQHIQNSEKATRRV